MKVTTNVAPPPPPFTVINTSMRTQPSYPGTYTSDSAESLQEIPVSNTHHGALYQRSFQPDSAGTYPKRSRAATKYEKGSRSKHRSEQGVEGTLSHNHRRRRKDVPPLELSASSEDEYPRRRAKTPLSHV